MGVVIILHKLVKTMAELIYIKHPEHSLARSDSPMERQTGVEVHTRSRALCHVGVREGFLPKSDISVESKREEGLVGGRDVWSLRKEGDMCKDGDRSDVGTHPLK